MPALASHPVREELLRLIRRDGEATATTAAAELGGSTGLYSFHLRQLARYGVIAEAPASDGRARPWRLATLPGESPRPASSAPAKQAHLVTDAELSEMARGLEDESYRRWLELRDSAPGKWRQEAAFSQAVYLTPEELAGLADVIRALIGQYQHRETMPSARPPDAAPVAVVARLFPLLHPAELTSRSGRRRGGPRGGQSWTGRRRCRPTARPGRSRAAAQAPRGR